MSKKCMHRRAKRLKKLNDKYSEARKDARKIVNDPNSSFEEKMAALKFFEKKAKNASAKVRQTNPCPFTGRVRGKWTKHFGMGRGMLRSQVRQGNVPGVVSSSW